MADRLNPPDPDSPLQPAPEEHESTPADPFPDEPRLPENPDIQFESYPEEWDTRTDNA